ncbi:Hypothetical protein POVR1_LOCUS410 [uncultured virus]|nr:Hypothetical protein POVR1_LOCUS410 [uncultured virus]
MEGSRQMDKKIIWDIHEIFECEEGGYQEHTGDGVIYYNCTLLIDFGPLKKGHKCNISIDSATSGDFTMHVGCNGYGYGGSRFVPAWTYMGE